MGMPFSHALVTGASGFLGSRLCARLLADGVTVTATSRDPDFTSRSIAATWHRLDLSDGDAVRATLVHCSPDVVFHLAGHVSGSRETETVIPTLIGNVVSTVNVLLGAIAAGCGRVVIAGSYEEPQAAEPPRSPYAAAKSAATGYARMFSRLYDLSTVVLRVAMVYGPGQRDETKLVPYVTRSFLSGTSPALASGDRTVDWVFVEDVVEAFVAAATIDGLSGEVVEIGSGEVHTVREVVELIARECRADVPATFHALPDRPDECVRAADTDTARRLLGWEASTPLETGLALTVRALRADHATPVPHVTGGTAA